MNSLTAIRALSLSCLSLLMPAAALAAPAGPGGFGGGPGPRHGGPTVDDVSAMGRCCYERYNGLVIEEAMSKAKCAEIGGSWHDPALASGCEVGACCYETWSAPSPSPYMHCYQATFESCSMIGGTWWGVGVGCDEPRCEYGACCFWGVGTAMTMCISTKIYDCDPGLRYFPEATWGDEIRFKWNGAGSACEDYDCSESDDSAETDNPGSNDNANGKTGSHDEQDSFTSIIDLLDVLNDWGRSVEPREQHRNPRLYRNDYNRNSKVDMPDLLIVISRLAV